MEIKKIDHKKESDAQRRSKSLLSLLQNIKKYCSKNRKNVSEAYLGLREKAITELFYWNSEDINYLCKKNFIMSVWQCPKYTSEDFFFLKTREEMNMLGDFQSWY